MTNRDGDLDERFLLAFQEIVDTLPPASVIVGTACSRQKISPKLSQSFLLNFELGALTWNERSQLSRSIVEQRALTTHSNSIHKYIAGKAVICVLVTGRGFRKGGGGFFRQKLALSTVSTNVFSFICKAGHRAETNRNHVVIFV